MIRTCFFLWLLLLANAFLLKAQDPQYAFRVSFTDKQPTLFSLHTPADYLSSRALDRRLKYGIAIDSLDLPVPVSYTDSVLTVTGGVLHTTSRWLNSCVVLCPDAAAAAAALSNLSFVQEFRQVAYYPTGLHQRPGQPDTTGPGGGARPTDFDEPFYGVAWSQIHLCHGEFLHEEGYMGAGKLIAVVDVGFSGVHTAPAFDSLFAGGRLADTWNFIRDTAHVFDYGAHGCQTLSCMAAYQPGTHVGTAPEASYALYATDDLSSEQAIEEDNYVAATERADSIGADLISTSLGYNTFDNPADSYTYSELDGHTTLVARIANIATTKGILTVASAGNEGSSNWHYILSPGDADSAMTIGSVNNLKSPASTSGRGPNASAMLKPDVCAQGVQAAVVQASGSIGYQSGTSYATPVLAGLAACLMQALPEKTPSEIRSLIAAIADSAASPNYNVGNGVPDFRKALGANSIVTHGQLPDPFILYPNPASRFVSIRMREGGTAKSVHYHLADLGGSTLQQGTLPLAAGVLHLQAYATGLYLLQLECEGFRRTYKLRIDH